MFTQNLQEHLRYLKKKDEIAIKKASRRMGYNSVLDRRFACRVYQIYDTFKLEGPRICEVLKDTLDNPLGEMFFCTPFDQVEVCSVLLDAQFVSMLMCNNLLRRTANLNDKSSGALKLRVYVAILNYAAFKKNNK